MHTPTHSHIPHTTHIPTRPHTHTLTHPHTPTRLSPVSERGSLEEKLSNLEDESAAVKVSLIQLLQEKSATNKTLALENSRLNQKVSTCAYVYIHVQVCIPCMCVQIVEVRVYCICSSGTMRNREFFKLCG